MNRRNHRQIPQFTCGTGQGYRPSPVPKPWWPFRLLVALIKLSALLAIGVIFALAFIGWLGSKT